MVISPKNLDIKLAYKAACKEIDIETIKRIKAYEKELAQKCKTNPKLIYAYVNEQSKCKDIIRSITTKDGETTAKPQEIANCLNDYFFEVFENEELDWTLPSIETIIESSFEIDLKFFSLDEIYKDLMKLDKTKSMGVDCVHPHVLKECATKFALPLSIIFTESIKSGAIPDKWKEANISSIFKKGSRVQRGNYRGISLTSVSGKLMEKQVKRIMVEHLTRNSLINEQQHGFVKLKSCVTNLLECLDIITQALNCGHIIDLIFLDFAKAFDKVWHRGLLQKLKSIGFNGVILDWIESFLSNRTQRVVIGECSSEWKKVLSGVPQGSVLGPLLFIIFINGMPNLTKHISKFFADDSKLIGIIRSILDKEMLQADLDMLVNWSKEWHMSFNYDKCKVMNICKNKNAKLVASEAPVKSDYSMAVIGKDERYTLDETRVERDLGIQLTDDLKWHTQTLTAANKANSVLGMLKRTFVYWNVELSKQLYVTFVRPHLEYAVSAWNPYRKKDIKILENIQRRATKLAPGIKHLAYHERLRIMGLTTLYERRVRGDAIQYFKIEKGLNLVKYTTPNRLAPAITSLGPASNIRGHPHRLERQAIKNCDQREFFFSNRMVPIWNSIPENIVNAKTTNQFKNLYDKYKKENG